MGSIAYKACVASASEQLGISASVIEAYYTKQGLSKDFSNYQMYTDLMKKKLEALNDTEIKTAYYELLKLTDNATSYESFVSGVNNLKKRFVGTSNEVAFGTVADITMSSYQYWTKNLPKWLELNKESPEFVGNNLKVKDVIKDDFYSAVGGFYSGAVTGPGGAVAGAMIFGMCGSAVSAFFLIW